MELKYLKDIKANFIDWFIDRNVVQSIGNSAWLLASWIDAMLEYTVLKHEVIYLSAKKHQIAAKIADIQLKWPRKKSFIECAYKLLLFTKWSKPEVRLVRNLIFDNGMSWFFNFENSKEVVLTMKVN